MITKAASGRPNPRAFTLIELLVVIVIIGILMAVVLTVAGRVTGGGKQRLTESTIQLCDKMWVQYVASRDGRPAESFVDDNGVEFPLVDGRVAAGPNGDPVNGMSAPSEPTLSLFLLNAVKSPEVDALVKSLDPRFIEENMIISALGLPQVRSSAGTLGNARGIIVKDAFGNPIHFVHPAYDGGFGKYLNPPATVANRTNLSVLRRTGVSSTTTSYYSRSYRPWAPAAGGAADLRTGDADEGICTGGAGYFYSAGMDGDPGTRDDNVYSVRPQFPELTRSFN